MSRLAHAVRTASQDAFLKVSLEAVADDLAAQNVSMEQHLDELDTMIDIARGLDSVVVSVESLDAPTLAQQSAARDTALNYLTLSGLTHSEAMNIFPSMESEEQVSTAWEKFKKFLKNLWDFIVASAKKLYEFLRQFFKQSSVAEKAAMVRLRMLRAELAKVKSGLTINAKLKIRPAHRYLLDQSHNLPDVSKIKSNIEAFIKARDIIQTKLPEAIIQVGKDLEKIIDDLALSGTPEQISASVEAHYLEMKNAVSPMFPQALGRLLGSSRGEIYLIHDRTLKIKNPLNVRDQEMTEEQVRANISHFGIEVTQINDDFAQLEDMGTVSAFSIAEISELLKLAEKLIDEGHSADQARTWQRIMTTNAMLTAAVGGSIDTLLKKSELSPKARNCMMLAANARHAMDRWSAAPYTQLNTVNVRVVESLLSMASDQIKNYELADSMEEKKINAKAETAREEKRKSAEQKAAKSK